MCHDKTLTLDSRLVFKAMQMQRKSLHSHLISTPGCSILLPWLEQEHKSDLFDHFTMDKISAKSVMYALLPMVVLLQFSNLVAAVDIIFYESTSECTGSGYAFNGIAAQVCCAVSAQDGGSVLVTSTSGSSEASQFYRDGSCATQVGSSSGDFCLVGGQFTGAFWFNARRRSLFSDSQTCNSQMNATGIVYTDDGTKGNWILTTTEAAEMYSQMQNIPDAEKSSWLESHGASYKQL